MQDRKVKEEAKLEAWLQRTAYKYKEYMTERNKTKEKKTLRSMLAEYYIEMVKIHGEVGKKRFPHLAYG